MGGGLPVDGRWSPSRWEVVSPRHQPVMRDQNTDYPAPRSSRRRWFNHVGSPGALVRDAATIETKTGVGGGGPATLLRPAGWRRRTSLPAPSGWVEEDQPPCSFRLGGGGEGPATLLLQAGWRRRRTSRPAPSGWVEEEDQPPCSFRLGGGGGPATLLRQAGWRRRTSHPAPSGWVEEVEEDGDI